MYLLRDMEEHVRETPEKAGATLNFFRFFLVSFSVRIARSMTWIQLFALSATLLGSVEPKGSRNSSKI
jgi:hypothetical protein